jgi:hypothetical protein
MDQGLPDLPGQLLRGKFFSPSSSDNNNVLMKANFATVASKEFSQLPFDPVPDDRLSHLGTDRDSESAFSLVVNFSDDDKMRRKSLFPRSRYIQKFRPPLQAGSLGELSLRLRRHFPILGPGLLGRHDNR